MKTVKQLLGSRMRSLCTIEPDTRVFDALKLMAEKDIGALPVVEHDRLVGIVSERDYARKVILLGRSSHDTPVREIMTERAVCVHLGNTIEECMALMTEKHVRHLPVMENDALLGILSIGDLVKETISEQQFVIRQLESYIHS
jgi:CBS domain-containing protein